MKRIGIDFGTCNIKAAEKKKNGDVVYVKLGKRIEKPMVPNIISYENKEDGVSVYIGDPIVKRNIPEQDVVRHIKSFLQEADWSRELSFGKVVTAYDVTSDIMKSLYDAIHNSNKEDELSATITVPVNFSVRQQKIVEKAAKSAGFIVESVITEPVASLFYLMQDSFDENHNVLVFDFGGGTLDMCLAVIKQKEGNSVVKIEATAGISYGGNDVNKDILENLVRVKACEKLRQALEEPEDRHGKVVNRYRIMESLDDMKAELFSEDEVEEENFYELLVQMYDGRAVELGTYTVEEIYKMFDDNGWEKRLTKLLDKLFEESSSLTPDDITDVFVVGGTSSIPYFRNCLTEYFESRGHEDTDSLYDLNDEIDWDDRVYSSVSKGAAIYSELLESEEMEIQNRNPLLVYSKDENEAECARISSDLCYQGSASALAVLSEKMKEKKKIEIYQTIYGEDEKEVYIGAIELKEDVAETATHYRLTVDENRNIKAELGRLSEDEGNPFSAEWCLELAITV